MVAATPEAFGTYRDRTGHRPDENALALYRARWALDDLAAYTGDLRRPHGRTADTEKALHAIAVTLRALIP